jgi:hypothetical protein
MKTLLTLSFLLVFGTLINAGEPYDGYSNDKALLRSTTSIPTGSDSEKTINASSVEAIQAAHRLFSTISMLFKTRDEVFEILGDPASISGYGVKAKPEKDADLVYRFDSGYGGWQFTIKFRNDRVCAIQAEGID